jgi:hypothetical protein
MAASQGELSFERDIKPLFRESDRDAMEFTLDLWDYQDVRDNADAILEQVETGRMPCDDAWPEDKIDLFRRWTEAGMPA